MKHIHKIFLLGLIGAFLFNACGPSEAERQAAEKARLDSLRAVQQAEIDRLMKAREDSIARAQAALLQKEEKDYSDFSFTADGEFAVQVGAWRSQEKANSFVNIWNERGYEKSYVVKVGDEATGDIWFRVRMGLLESKEEGERLGKRLNEEFGTPFWVSKVQK